MKKDNFVIVFLALGLIALMFGFSNSKSGGNDNPETEKISILFPTDGETINCWFVTVYGEYEQADNVMAVVTINGEPAMFRDGRFAINNFPLEEGKNIIRATASYGGKSYSSRITINVSKDGPHFTVSPSPTSAAVPFKGSLALRGNIEIKEPEFEFADPHNILDITAGLKDDDSVVFSVNQPGLFIGIATLAVGNESYEARFAVLGLDMKEESSRIKAVYSAMRNALAVGDVQTALSFYFDRGKYNYQAVKESGNLAAVVKQLPNEIGGIEILENHASADIIVNGIHTELQFIRMPDGTWKIY